MSYCVLFVQNVTAKMTSALFNVYTVYSMSFLPFSDLKYRGAYCEQLSTFIPRFYCQDIISFSILFCLCCFWHSSSSQQSELAILNVKPFPHTIRAFYVILHMMMSKLF